eukprot:259922-Amorphochlora_amoeboformis.AAC.1
MKGSSQAVHPGISRNVPTSRTYCNLRRSSESVTWRDVTLCHGISGSPVLPDTTRAIPATTGKVISKQSPGSPAISSFL